MRIVVVGAGTAGIPAALTALEQGADVVLLEKTGRIGGQLWASGAITSGAGSQLQRKKGIVDSPAAHEQEVWQLGRERADPILLARATIEAGSTIDWLVSLGVRFTPESPQRLGLQDQHETYSAPRSYVLEAPAELGVYRGPVLAERLAAALEPWSGSQRLTLRLSTRAVELMCDETGGVVGVRVDGPGGPEEVVADAVILTTGGYGASKELLQRFHGAYERLITQGLPHTTGDGILLSERVGGVVVNEDLVLPSLGAVEDPDRPGFRLGDAMVTIGRPPAASGDIWVNRLGRRFVAEDGHSPDARERAILAQPGATMFAIFDDAMRRGLTPEIAEWTASRLGDPPDPRLVTSAPTLEELAVRIAVPPAALAVTVRAYNASAAERADPLGRTSMPKPLDMAPFHALRTVSAVIVTFAGVRVDEHLRVVTAGGAPISGLYAAGEVLGGGQIQGDGFSSGMSVTPAIAFGRLAAREALDREASLVER